MDPWPESRARCFLAWGEVRLAASVDFRQQGASVEIDDVMLEAMD